MTNSIDFKRLTNDVNGNPRYVCHFLNLLKDSEKNNTVVNLSVDGKYQLAIARAKKIGGKKYHNNQYGGGIVFQSYNIRDTENKIIELLTK